MKNLSAVILLSMLIATAANAMTLEQKHERLQQLEVLVGKAEHINIDAYKREFNYQKLGLTLEQKAHSEARLMAEQIGVQLSEAYAHSIKQTGSHEATVAELTSALDNDLKLAAPELQSQLRNVSVNILGQLGNGKIDIDTVASELAAPLTSRIEERGKFFSPTQTAVTSITSNSTKEPKFEYANKQEFIDVLTSREGNTCCVGNASISLSSGKITSNDTTLSLYVKLYFKGVYIDAGPKVTFTREWSSHVSIVAEGMDPILDSKGYFDQFMIKNGKRARRFMTMTCQAGLFFQTKYAINVGIGAGGDTGFLSPVGAYGSVRLDNETAKRYTNSVTLTSRQVVVPDHIGKAPVTLEILNRICHNDFLSASIGNGLTVKGSLNVMMKNVVASLKFRNPKTKCVVDDHCFDWYNKLGMVRVNNYPRCILDEKTGEFAYCALRGLKGQACAVMENGKRVSADMFEYTCDAGLRCHKVREAGWFLEGITGRLWSAPKGQCH